MSGFWRLCIEISDKNVFPYGEMAVWPDENVRRAELNEVEVAQVRCTAAAGTKPF